MGAICVQRRSSEYIVNVIRNTHTTFISAEESGKHQHGAPSWMSRDKLRHRQGNFYRQERGHSARFSLTVAMTQLLPSERGISPSGVPS